MGGAAIAVAKRPAPPRLYFLCRKPEKLRRRSQPLRFQIKIPISKKKNMHITGATTIAEATTSKQVGCVVNVYETGNPVSAEGPSSCTIEVHLRYRYQLKIRSNEGTLILIEDLETPEMCTSQRVPVVFPLSKWRELYFSDILKCWNLEASVRNFLLPKIVDAAISIAERKGDKGFRMLAKIGILKAEILSKDETARIASEL